MGKCFNTTGICRPEKHYMVDIGGRLDAIRRLVDKGEYFVINRARQYGKTTTIRLLKKKLSDAYVVFSISFEGMEKEAYESASSFCQRVSRLLYNVAAYSPVEGLPEEVKEELAGMRHRRIDLADLADFISHLCSKAERPVVLMIDEVDQASNQEIFLSFLGMLRDKYLNREEQPAFQSVILAGVYDIKNLKLKVRSDALQQYNSPWNIAADFTVDMSFSEKEVEGMLLEYEKDHGTGMDVHGMASMIYEYTNGYPFLVSRLCKIMDETVVGRGNEESEGGVWTKEGMTEAVKYLLMESNTLFDDVIKKITDFPELKEMLHAVLFRGEKIPYNIYSYATNIGHMFGFLMNTGGMVEVSNRIFETLFYNLFLAEEILDSKIYKAAMLEKPSFVRNGKLDMERILEKFVEAFTDIYADAEESFIEENGRRFFLLYLKPIINGVGNYYIEARTRDMRRTDVIIDYMGEQYICELKIWHGEEYRKRGEQQLIGYLEDYHLAVGYMISFSFNKKKQIGVQKLQINGRTLIEAVV